MDLFLLRDQPVDDLVLGRLFIDHAFTWYTLEDSADRIPPGRYRVGLSHSTRYNQTLPLVTGHGRVVRMHPGIVAGTTPPDPSPPLDHPGGILVGGGVSKSTALLTMVYCEQACQKLVAALAARLAGGEPIDLEVGTDSL
ncbi:MAG TPA: DUF5675 family protein [Pseudonocardiaceae bacterium]|nr:DUF5675 family protein [Pseudonocardiaceae bacterium]